MDRGENIRRVGEVAKLFADSSTIAITSFISPYRADRALVRALHDLPTNPADSPIPFVEIHIDVPLAVAESRDPKGLYKRARKGEIPGFTGISAPYEEPEEPDFKVRSDQCSVDEAVKQIVEFLEEKGLLSPGN